MNKLNLGAGNRIESDAINHDRVKHRPEIDVAWDLNYLPWPWADESFDLVMASAVLEHLNLDLVQSVNECWRILRPEGMLYLKLPYWRSEVSSRDPTHRWRYTLESCDVFDPDTAYGQEYIYYTARKWKIINRATLNDGRSSIHITMQVCKTGQEDGMRKKDTSGLTIRAQGPAADLWRRVAGEDPKFAEAYKRADRQAGKCLPYQRAAIYRLAEQYNREGARILEIGTWCGNTAVLMALAAPAAMVTTCEPAGRRTPGLRKVFASYPNIRMVSEKSWDYLNGFEGPPWDMIFVDGDHNRVRLDLPWFNLLKAGGLMLFHDYTPGDAKGMPCQPVYEGVNALGEALGRELDVLIVDDQGIGLAGFYRRAGERWE